MSLLLHAITPIDGAAPSLVGLRGQRLVEVHEQGLAAYATDFQQAPEQLTRDDLLAHHALVMRLDEAFDSVLPARFPTWMVDDGAVHRLVGSRRGELSTALDRVRGRTELSVTAMWLTDQDRAAPVSDASTPGRRYLLERRQAFAGSDRRRERARELADSLERLVGPDLVERQRRVCPSSSVAVSMALLVPRTRVSEIKARLSPAEPAVRILVNGPWPPYSFVDIR